MYVLLSDFFGKSAGHWMDNRGWEGSMSENDVSDSPSQWKPLTETLKSGTENDLNGE